MELNLIRSTGAGLTFEKESSFHKDLLADKSILWIDLKVKDRSSLKTLSNELQFGPELYERLQSPGKTFRLQNFGPIWLQDLHLTRNEIGLPSYYVTFIHSETQVLTLSEYGLGELEHFRRKVDRAPKNAERDLLIHYFLDQVVDDDLSFSRKIKLKIDSFSNSLSDGFGADDVSVINGLRDEVVRFEEVLEDQYLSIGLIPEVLENGITPANLSHLKAVTSHFEHIQNRMQRAEDKVEYIFQQYRNSVQEETNRRINTLTIVQAIFVPLTFIAGIYGMNFSKMPELDWSNGYFYALGLMGFIALGELWIFWRSGWFR